VKENHKLAVTDKVGDRAKFSSGPRSAQELAGSQVGLQERLQQRPPVQVVPLGRQDAALDQRRGELHCPKFKRS